MRLKLLQKRVFPMMLWHGAVAPFMREAGPPAGYREKFTKVSDLYGGAVGVCATLAQSYVPHVFDAYRDLVPDDFNPDAEFEDSLLRPLGVWLINRSDELGTLPSISLFQHEVGRAFRAFVGAAQSDEEDWD